MIKSQRLMACNLFVEVSKKGELNKTAINGQRMNMFNGKIVDFHFITHWPIYVKKIKAFNKIDWLIDGWRCLYAGHHQTGCIYQRKWKYPFELNQRKISRNDLCIDYAWIWKMCIWNLVVATEKIIGNGPIIVEHLVECKMRDAKRKREREKRRVKFAWKGTFFDIIWRNQCACIK